MEGERKEAMRIVREPGEPGEDQVTGESHANFRSSSRKAIFKDWREGKPGEPGEDQGNHMPMLDPVREREDEVIFEDCDRENQERIRCKIRYSL